MKAVVVAPFESCLGRKATVRYAWVRAALQSSLLDMDAPSYIAFPLLSLEVATTGK